MAKTKISEFSSTPGNNTDIDSINIAEGCAPSGINDAIRELMAQLKDFQQGTAGDSFNGPVGTTTAAAGAFTTLAASGAVTLSGGTANGVPYLNGSKVLTTGSALTFDGTRLRTVGYLYVNSDTDYLRMIDAADSTYIARITKNGSNIELWNRTGGGLIFGANDSEGMRLTSTGLGIGTSSPGYKLDVRGTLQVLNGTTPFLVDTFGAVQAPGGVYVNTTGTRQAGLNSSGNDLRFRTGNTDDRMILDSSGNLLVGTTSADPIAALVNGVQLGVTNSRIASASIGLSVARRASDGAAVAFLRDATTVGTITVTTSATAYNTSSDYRLKENIAPMTGALAKVAQLKPVTYTWKTDGSAGEGFIAHELAEVCPAAVTGEKDAVDAEGKPQYQGIDVSFLVGTLTAAIQEQQAIIEDMKTRLAAAGI